MHSQEAQMHNRNVCAGIQFVMQCARKARLTASLTADIGLHVTYA